MIDRSGYQKVAEASRTALDALSDDDLAREAFKYEVRVTSGTTGGVQLLSVVKSDKNSFRRAERMTRCILATGSWNSRLAHLRHSLYARNVTQTLCIDIRELEGAALEAIEDFAADGILGFPSFVLRVLEVLSSDARARIKRLSFVGERISPAHCEVLSELVPSAVVRSIYASAEFGLIGYQCEHLPVTQYHPVSGVSISLINADEDGVGEIVLSRHQEGNAAVEDYRIGDAVRLVERACACGEKVTFEQMGRLGYDFVKAAGLTFHVDAFDRAAKSVGLGVYDYRVELRLLIKNTRILPQLTILLRRNTGVSAIASVQAAFENIRLTETRSLADLIRDDVCAPLLFSELDDSVVGKKSIRLKVVE